MNQTNKYTLYGALFGLCFPIGSIVFLRFSGEISEAETFWATIVEAHQFTLLYVIDTAPFFLGLFARLAGRRQDRIEAVSASLEQQVAEQTESLRKALEEARRANEMIAHMAEHDTVTGLLNRHRLQDALEDWVERSKRYRRSLAIMFLDLDRFKLINDTYGHQAGDHYLQHVGELLSQTLRSTDIVARWGGDEFAVLIPETSAGDAQTIANKLLGALARAVVDIEGEPVQPSASIGIALFPEHAENADELVARADAAMYEAKKAGRGCWRLYAASAEEVERVQEHIHWEARIRKALEDDQFILLYQPLLQLKNRQTDSYEALLRMEDREGNLIRPGLFMEAAERFELSAPIDFMVLRKSLRRLDRVRVYRPDVWVSINFSSKTLQHDQLLDYLDTELRNAVSPENLCLEINEQVALEYLGRTRAVGDKLREFGSSLILDDFGLGPAFAPSLQKLPITTVKLAVGLVRKLDTPETYSYIKGLVAMAHELDTRVVAKAVEEPETIETLRELGIDYAQGFAIGRPMESIEQIMGEGYHVG